MNPGNHLYVEQSEIPPGYSQKKKKKEKEKLDRGVRPKHTPSNSDCCRRVGKGVLSVKLGGMCDPYTVYDLTKNSITYLRPNP